MLEMEEKKSTKF